MIERTSLRLLTGKGLVEELEALYGKVRQQDPKAAGCGHESMRLAATRLQFCNLRATMAGQRDQE